MANDRWISGSWNVICDVCGRKYKNTDVRKRWDGLIVCAKDFEHRHVADFFKLKAEKNNVVDPRHEADDQFVNVTYISTGDTLYCSVTGRSGVASLAVAGCAVAGNGLSGGL